MSATETKLHGLKDNWYVYYQDVVKKDEPYDSQLEGIDYVRTVEEVFATLNTFPTLTLLPADASLFFARNKAVPKFEEFPGGCRVSLFTKTKTQADDVVLRVMAAVIGEDVTKKVTDGEPVCDIIRLTHKPHRVHTDACRLDVWCRKNDKVDELEKYFKDLVSLIPGVTVYHSMIE